MPDIRLRIQSTGPSFPQIFNPHSPDCLMRIDDCTTLQAVGEEARLGLNHLDIDARHSSLPLKRGSSLSHWLQGARSDPILDHRTTAEMVTQADYVIIGSGLSGLLVAWSLLHSDRPPPSVVMLEAREFCSGATGRNAGHCKPDIWRGFSAYAERHGKEESKKILANERETWERLVKFVQENEVDCELWTGETLDVLMDEEVKASAAETFEAYKAAGGDVSGIGITLDSAKAAELSRIDGAKAVYSWNASTLNPWKLASFIGKQCLDLGLNLQTWTPATSIQGHPNDWQINTARGSILTSTIIHTTNAYASALLPHLENIIAPLPHLCSRVIPPSSMSGSQALRNSYAVLWKDSLYTINPRSGSDGALLFGGSPEGMGSLKEFVSQNEHRCTDDSLGEFQAVTQSINDLCARFDNWGAACHRGFEGRFDTTWSGIIGMTADELPLVGAVPGKPGQWMSCGHNGHGMARIFTCSPGLVKLIQGASWEQTGLPDSFQVSQARLESLKAQTVRMSIY